MRHVSSNPAEARATGRLARDDMLARFSPAVVAKLVADRLAVVQPLAHARAVAGQSWGSSRAEGQREEL